jgi:HK97 family phage portal protein
MNLPFGITLARTKAQPTRTPSRINEERFNKLYDILLRYFGKGQMLWNKTNLQHIVENGYLFNPDVYSIINKIIHTASMIDWQMMEVKDDKAFRKYKNYKRSKNLDAMSEYSRKSMEPVEDHPLLNLLEQPNPHTTGILFDQSLLGYYCLLGNSYINKLTITGSPGGVPGELYVLPAYMVKIILGRGTEPIEGYSIDQWNNSSYKYLPEDIYHFKTFNPDYSQGQFMYGATPSMIPSLEKSNESYTAAVTLIQNLGAMGILSSGNDDILDPEQAKKVRDKYATEYGGSKNRGKILIVGHKMEYVNMAQSISDLNLIQGQKQDFLTFCRIFGVDSRIMGDVERSTYANMNEARKDFIMNRILPLKYMQSEAYNKFLLPLYNSTSTKKYYLDIDYNSIPELQTDTNLLSTRIQNEIRVGLLSPADGAKLLGYKEPTDPNAKKLWVGTNMVPMEMAGAAKQLPPAKETPQPVQE